MIDIDLSYNVTTLENNSMKNSGAQNDDNIQNTDTININEEMESENKIKEENYNPEINFEIKLKNEPISNRIRSARKFLEENENKFLCDRPKNMKINQKKNEFIFKYEKESNLNLGKNDFFDLNQNKYDEDLEEIYEKKRKKIGIVESDFNKKDFNFLNYNSNGFQFANYKEPLFIGSRRNHLLNNNNAWGI